MRAPSSQKCRLDLAPPLADRVILGFPIDYGPVLLRRPFGFHLAILTFVGQLVSSVIWLVSAALGTWVTPKASILAVVIGSFFIFALTQMLLRLSRHPPRRSTSHP